MGVKFETQLQVVVFACEFIVKNSNYKKKKSKQFAQPMFALGALLEACEVLHKDLWLWKSQTGEQSANYPGFHYLEHALEHQKMKVPFKDFIMIYNSAFNWLYHKKKHDYNAEEHADKKKGMAMKIAKMLK